MGYEVRKLTQALGPKHPDRGTGRVVIRVDGGIYSKLHIKPPPSESLHQYIKKNYAFLTFPSAYTSCKDNAAL